MSDQSENNAQKAKKSPGRPPKITRFPGESLKNISAREGVNNFSGEGQNNFSDRHAWEKQKGEPERAYFAFATYRDFGINRSIAATQRATKLGYSTLQKWASKWGWDRRASAYDAWEESIRRVENATRISEGKNEITALALAILHKLKTHVDAWSDTGYITPSEAGKLLNSAIRAWHIGLGIPLETKVAQEQESIPAIVLENEA